MKNLKEFLIPAGVALIMTLIVCSMFHQGKVGSSVPYTAGTEDISVDVCINQACDYIADGQDDQREIKQAIDAVLAAGGGIVNIRTGDYDISSSIAVSLSDESLIIQGDGYNTKLTNSMTATGENGTMFVIVGSGSTYIDNIEIRDLSFVGSATCGMGVRLKNVYNAKVLSSKFTGFASGATWGIGLFASSTGQTVIDSCAFNSNSEDIMIGDEAYNTYITNNRFKDSGEITIGADAVGVDISGNSNLVTVTDSGSYNFDMEMWSNGSCADATTTVLAVLNPFGMDVYVNRFMIDVTSGTSTLDLTCGTSTTQYLSADPTDLLIDDLTISTSTLAANATSTKAYNTSGAVSSTSGFEDPGTNSEDLIIWGSGEYITCYADETDLGGGASAVANAENLYSCTYKIHSFK